MDVTFTACSACLSVNRVKILAAESKAAICSQCRGPLPYHDYLSDTSVESLEKLIKVSPLPVVADFWANWCSPCRAFAPTFAALAKELAGKCVFVKVDTEAHPKAMEMFQIRGIPALLAFKDGKEQARQAGAMPLPMFRDWVRPII